MDIESMVRDMHGMMHEMKPVLSANSEALKSIDERTRALEKSGVEHEVKIVRVQQDLDGMGRKVRAIQDNYRLRGVEEKSGSWRSFVNLMEAVIELPHWAHAVITLGGGVVVFGMYVVRHLKP